MKTIQSKLEAQLESELLVLIKSCIEYKHLVNFNGTETVELKWNKSKFERELAKLREEYKRGSPRINKLIEKFLIELLYE